MSARPLTSFSFASQKTLVMQSMQASIAARTKVGLDLQSPMCIYGLCEAHNVGQFAFDQDAFAFKYAAHRRPFRDAIVTQSANRPPGRLLTI